MFSRASRTSGRHARAERARRGQQALAEELDLAGQLGDAGNNDDPPANPAPPEPAGPYDVTQAPAGVTRLDLGSLQVPSVPEVEVRVSANQEGAIQQLLLVYGDSVLQVGAFAAPRTDPIWDEVRGEIRQKLFDDGVAAEEVAGEHGTELRARVRTPQGLRDLRFVGVDGPRWLVRAVYQGPAATDPAKSGPLAECLRGLVVDRGTEAKPAKEPLPLRLTTEMAAQLPDSAPTATAAGPPPAVPVDGSAASPAVSGVPAGTTSAPGGRPAGGRRKPSPRPRRRG